MPYIDHVHIRSTNPAKTIDFFKTFFGARVAREFENLGRKITVLSLDSGSNLAILHIPPAVENPKPEMAIIDHIGLAVKNIEALIRQLKEKGFKFPVDLSEAPSGVKIAFCLGPDNLYLELVERP